nr:UDP-glycosyltransferase 76G1-like isoform X2 [Tanacetum cinerariifolium]
MGKTICELRVMLKLAEKGIPKKAATHVVLAIGGDNCHHAPTMPRGVVSLSCLVDNRFIHKFTDYGLSVSKDNVIYFNVIPRDGIYEIDMHDILLNRRIVLFPLPFQGHINPMLQLANILHTHGFKITVIHAEYNSPNHSNYPHFTFMSIKDNFSEIADELDTNPDASYFLNYLNRSCVDSFKECLSRLLDKEAVACLITDAGFYFTQTVADELNLPRMALRTSSLALVLAYGALPFYSNNDCFYLTKEEFREVAYALANIGLPFLWVVRPGIVRGSKWIEALPEKFLERVGDKGRIVKWSPQQEVLAHPVTGCFWTHSGWNSTLESICEGVPMICSPCFVDQPINARYVSDVWKIGIFLEDGFERVRIESAIKRIMMDKEGEELRERICDIKEKVSQSLDEGARLMSH